MLGRPPLVLLACIVPVLVARAAGASPAAHLVYVRDATAAACPDEPGLRNAVQQRVGYDPFFPWAKTTIVVEVTGDGSSFVARVRLVDAKGLSSGARELRSGATGCAGLIDATALAISIALDMNASAVDEPSPSPVVDPPPSPPPEPPPAPESPAPSAPTEAPAAAREAASSPTATLTSAAWLEALAAIGVTPGVVPGFDLGAAVRLGNASVGVEVRADAAGTIDAFAGGGQASVLLVAGALVPCVHAGMFFACAVGSLGWVHASGVDVLQPRSGSAFELAAGPRIGVEVPFAPAWALRVRGDLLVDTLRPAVSVDGGVWRLPPVSGVAAAGVAYHFP